MESKNVVKDIIDALKSEFKDKVTFVREDTHTYGTKKKVTLSYWIRSDKNVFKEVVRHISDGTNPFLAVISGRDSGKDIELIYHFYLKPDVNSTKPCLEVGLNLLVSVPKKKPVLPTITDIIPGALITELEKQEMLGVKIEGIGDERVFLPENHPKCFYPWRKDQNA